MGFVRKRRWAKRKRGGRKYFIGVVEVQQLRARLIHLLVTLAAPAHRQRRKHVDVMARQVQADQALKQERPARPGGAEEDEQAGRRAAVRHHVQHGAKLGGLAKVARCYAIEGVEQTRYAVEEGTGSWVQGHVVEGGYGEDYTGIAWW